MCQKMTYVTRRIPQAHRTQVRGVRKQRKIGKVGDVAPFFQDSIRQRPVKNRIALHSEESPTRKGYRLQPNVTDKKQFRNSTTDRFLLPEDAGKKSEREREAPYEKLKRATRVQVYSHKFKRIHNGKKASRLEILETRRSKQKKQTKINRGIIGKADSGGV